jgi:hypothetical protein
MIYQLATKLLGLVADDLESQGIVLPERQYVAPGADLVFDCEQLTVRHTRIIPGMQGSDTPVPAVTHKKIRKSAEFFVTLVRCVPTMQDDGTPPSVTEYNDASKIMMDDAVALRVALEDIEHQHLLVPVNVPVTVGELRTMGPLGGFAANEMMYSVEIVSNTMGWVG